MSTTTSQSLSEEILAVKAITDAYLRDDAEATDYFFSRNPPLWPTPAKSPDPRTVERYRRLIDIAKYILLPDRPTN